MSKWAQWAIKPVQKIRISKAFDGQFHLAKTMIKRISKPEIEHPAIER